MFLHPGGLGDRRRAVLARCAAQRRARWRARRARSERRWGFRSRRCAEVCEALIVCCRSPACSFRERVRVKFSHGKCAPIRSNSFFRSRHGSPQERNFYSLSIAADSRGVLLGYTSLYRETRHIVRALHQMLCYSRSSSILAGKMRLAGKAKLEGLSARRGFGKEGAHGHHRC